MSVKRSYQELEKRVHELEYAEEKLKVLEIQLQDEIAWHLLFMNETKEGVVVMDQDCSVVKVNKAFADTLGYTVEEMMHLHAWDWEEKYSKHEILELAKQVDDKGHYIETTHRCKDGKVINVTLSNNGAIYQGKKLIFCICHDITDRKNDEKEQERIIKELQEALAEVNTLRGILPLCSFCKKIRKDDGYWEKVDVYIRRNSQADISHSICPDCSKIHYPDVSI